MKTEMKDLTEDQLIVIAETSNDHDEANAAMNELRERFDPNYVWCPDLDYAVVKMEDCPEQ
jgi:hypothetical protein